MILTLYKEEPIRSKGTIQTKTRRRINKAISELPAKLGMSMHDTYLCASIYQIGYESLKGFFTITIVLNHQKIPERKDTTVREVRYAAAALAVVKKKRQQI